jgi:DNA-directed RNA polymerase subunit beta'
MAVSGARGNLAQLMKIIGTPLAVNDEKKGVGSVIIEHAYSSGLTPAENWATMPEARANNVASVVSIAKPGEMNKVLIANMVSKIITQIDCGTHAGVHLSVNDANCLDRYIADDQGLFKRNTLITASFLQNAKLHNISNLLVRSPMTCAATKGVCQHCWGLDEKGRLPAIGTNVGVRSAQAMTEPLTQMSLSSKHSVLTIKEKKPELTGFKGVRQLLEVPQNFQHEAILAPVTGFITNVEKASQGGHYIDIADQRMYADPGLTVIVQTGTKVHAGDQLTNGIPHPAKVVEHKGLGEGRQYFVNALHRVYANEGVNLDKRHFELLAKTNMNFVRILEHDPDHPELLKGDTITYNTFRDTYAKEPVRKLIGEAVGHRLGEDIAHHTVGTPITETLAKSFQDQGIHSVSVIKKMPKIEFVMRNFSMNPLMDSDWIARLGHRQLKGSIQQAVQIGEESNIHGTHPIPAYVHGAELKTGPNGEY